MSSTEAPSSIVRGLARAGVVVLLLAVAWNVGVDVRELFGAGESDGVTVARAPVLLAMRAGLLMATGAALLMLRARVPTRWRLPVVVAGAVVALSVVADLWWVLSTFGLVADPSASLGDEDDVHRRLYRLGVMAARAVPLLALVAACERARADEPTPAEPSPLAQLVLRVEPYAFAIGVGTLSLLLVLSAFVHKEIAWALPLGSDTTLCGCAAAAIRARRRGDPWSFTAWLTVCASMGVGLLMGLYAFGGPLPAPELIGAYRAPMRVLLRDAHVLAIVAAIAALIVSLFAANVRPRSPS